MKIAPLLLFSAVICIGTTRDLVGAKSEESTTPDYNESKNEFTKQNLPEIKTARITLDPAGTESERPIQDLIRTSSEGTIQNFLEIKNKTTTLDTATTNSWIDPQDSTEIKTDAVTTWRLEKYGLLTDKSYLGTTPEHHKHHSLPPIPDITVHSDTEILRSTKDRPQQRMVNALQDNDDGKIDTTYLAHLKRAKIRSGAKVLGQKINEDETEHVGQDNDSETSEVYDDYGEEDSIYTLAHFRDELYSYVDDRVSTTNGSILELIVAMQEKINQLENQLTENMASRCDLESKLRVALTPKRGDLRILTKSKCTIEVTAGYLQFYTGTEWGFVCDDFFTTDAYKVACRQLGYNETDKATHSSYQKYQHDVPFDSSWKFIFSIVLDDVQCTGQENSIKSCKHSDIGTHDCMSEEVVFLAC